MKAIYIIKDNKIYEVINEKEAVEIEINDGVASKTKNKVKYDSKNDFLYTFFEIKAKFSPLFETNEEIFEDEEFNKVIEEKDRTIAELKARVRELEEIVDNLTKQLEEYQASKETDEGEPESDKDVKETDEGEPESDKTSE